MSKFKKLKVAVGVNGNFVFLEKFPDEELHYTMNDELIELESNIDFTEPPGIYLAELEWVQEQSDWTGEYDAYLDIIKLEKTKL